MSGLFDTFTIAKRGLTVQQGAINTTAHNISNANTVGYSRQRAVAETTTPFGGMSRFDSSGVGQIGTGAEITSIQRIRDSFIDYQVRSESGTSGYYTSKSQTLSQVEDVFGEPSDTGIQELVSKFYSAFQEVSKSPDKSDVKTVAIQKASALADAINYTYNQLKKTCEDSQTVLQTNVTDVNSYLDQINELNKQIGSVSAVGQAPNDLMDKRDNLLDQLSAKFGIKIDKDKFETINLSSTEYPTSNLVKSSPNDVNYSRLSYVESATVDTAGTKVTVKYYPLGDKNAELKSFDIVGDQTLADNLTQNRILIGDKDGLVGTTTSATSTTVGTDVAGVVTNSSTGVITKTVIADGKTTTTQITPPIDATGLKKVTFQTYKYEATNSVDNNHVKGEIAANQSVQETIQGYMDNLDRLAKGLAYSVNAIQTGSLTDGSTTQSLKDNLIFINSNNTTTDTGITAATIKVNSDLLTNANLINCNTTSTSGEGDGKRANAIANLNVLKMDLSNVLTTNDRANFLKDMGITGFSDPDPSTCLSLDAGTDGSTVDSYYKTIINNIAVVTQESSSKADAQETILAKLEDDRSQVSGVSLDEETTNLIQFQHAYQANAKMIATIDELLDVVINGLKR